MNWHIRDPRRFQKEVEIMRHGSHARLMSEGGRVFWLEDLRSPTGRPYRLVIDYPDRFPYEAPRAFVVEPRITGAPHVLVDGSLCLFDNPLAGIGLGTTALLVRNRAVTWFLLYEIWRVTSEWVGPQHGSVAA